MWCRLKSRVPCETVDNLLGRAGSVVSSSGSKESLHWVGKDFFLEHEQGAEPEGGFPISIPDQIASGMAASMASISMSRGEAVAFDSFEPHMPGPNNSPAPRLAMKIAYAEGRQRTQYLTRADALE